MEYLKLGNEEMKKDNFRKALDYFNKAIEKDKTLLYAYYNKLNILISLDDNFGVINFIEMFLNNFPDEQNLYILKAAYLVKTEQPDEALELLQKLYKTSVGNYFDMLTLNLLIRKALILKEAFKDFTGISDNSKIKEDKTFLTVIQLVLEGINTDILKYGIKQFDNFSDKQYTLSDLIRHLKDKSGIKNLHEFYRNSNPTTGYLNKAIELTFQNKYEEALEYANMYAKIYPEDEISVVAIRANSLYAMGKFEEALEYNYTMVKLWPSVTDYYNLIITLIKLNRLNELVEVLNTAFREFPEISQILTESGIEMYKQGNFEVAIIIFKKIAKITKKSYAYQNLANVLQASNRFQEASDAIDKALSENPNNYEMWISKSEVYLKLGKLDELLNISAKLIELKPNDIRSYLVKTRLLDHEGNYKEAIYWLLEVKEKIPENAEIYYHLSVYLYLANRFEEAIVNAKKYIEICDTNLDHSIFEILGKAQTKIGDNQGAKESLRKYCQHNPKSFGSICMLATVYSMVGEYDNAIFYANKALEIEPKNAKVLDFKELITNELNDLSMSKNENGFYNVYKKKFPVLNKVNRNYWNFKNILPTQKVFSFMNMNIIKIMRFIKKFK
jgi:tetratricopeptide (TPR) repeat protein